MTFIALGLSFSTHITVTLIASIVRIQNTPTSRSLLYVVSLGLIPLRHHHTDRFRHRYRLVRIRKTRGEQTR